MAIPSKKSPAVSQFLESTFGRTTAIVSNICVSCKAPALKFRDALSFAEYGISGLCQSCQDSVFGT